MRFAFLKEVETVDKTKLERHKECKRIGCILMGDGWTKSKPRFTTNFLVNNSSATVFFELVGTLVIYKSGQTIRLHN